MRIGADVTEVVGHTPMVRVRRLVGEQDAEIWAKLETMNPGGSIKDRAALGIVLDAERRGVLRPGSTICEATAGNTGVGLALIGVQRGYRVRIFIPEGYAEEKCVLMRGLGAEVVRTPEGEMMSGAIRRMLQFEEETPGAFAAMQFENPANPDRCGGDWRGVGGDVYGDCALCEAEAAGGSGGRGGERGQCAGGRRGRAASGGRDWGFVCAGDVRPECLRPDCDGG
jgi:hypothetical protein